MYIPSKLNEKDAQIQALRHDIRIVRESSQIETDNLSRRRDKYKTDAEKAQHQLQLMARDRDRIKRDLELSNKTLLFGLTRWRERNRSARR